VMTARSSIKVKADSSRPAVPGRAFARKGRKELFFVRSIFVGTLADLA